MLEAPLLGVPLGCRKAAIGQQAENLRPPCPAAFSGRFVRPEDAAPDASPDRGMSCGSPHRAPPQGV